MKKTVTVVMMAVLSAGAANGQKAVTDPNSWKKPQNYNNYKIALDGCYRGQDKIVVCTYTVSKSFEEPAVRWNLSEAVAIDQDGRQLQPLWSAWGASAKRVPAGTMAEGATFGDGYIGGGSASLSVGLPVKVSLGYQLAPQYTVIPTLRLMGPQMNLQPWLNVPITVPGAAKGLPTTGTTAGYSIGLSNCTLNADNRTYACNATLTPSK